MSEQCNMCRSCQWLFMQLSSRFHRNILWYKYVLKQVQRQNCFSNHSLKFLDLFSKLNVHSVGSFAVLAVSDINDCANNSCLNNATCIDQINGYTCNCSIGFTGAFCETGEIFIWHAIPLYGNLSLVTRKNFVMKRFRREPSKFAKLCSIKDTIIHFIQMRKMIDNNHGMFALLMHWQ